MSRRKLEVPKPPIAEVLRHLTGVDVRDGSGWVRTVCPFCEDRNGSASVNHEVGGFRCHQCGRSGDGLKLLSSELRLSFTEACDVARGLGGGVDARPKRRPSDLLTRRFQ